MHLAVSGSVLKKQKESWTLRMVTNLTPQAWLSTLMFLLLPTSLPTMWHCKGLEEECFSIQT